MSVKEDRKLLGKDSPNMADEQVMELIEQTHELAKLALKIVAEKRSKTDNEQT